MTDQEVLMDLLQVFATGLRQTISALPPAALNWRPDSEANNIGLTVWHISRALDLLKVRLLEQQPPDKEQWFTQGWRASTNYDPRGIGWAGFGNLSGYTQEQVAAVPLLPAHDLLAYFDQVVTALATYLSALPGAGLQEVAGGWPQTPQPSAYVVVRNFLLDGVGHLGEIRAIKAMWERCTGSGPNTIGGPHSDVRC